MIHQKRRPRGTARARRRTNLHATKTVPIPSLCPRTAIFPCTSDTRYAILAWSRGNITMPKKRHHPTQTQQVDPDGRPKQTSMNSPSHYEVNRQADSLSRGYGRESETATHPSSIRVLSPNTAADAEDVPRLDLVEEGHGLARVHHEQHLPASSTFTMNHHRAPPVVGSTRERTKTHSDPKRERDRTNFRRKSQ